MQVDVLEAVNDYEGNEVLEDEVDWRGVARTLAHEHNVPDDEIERLRQEFTTQRRPTIRRLIHDALNTPTPKRVESFDLARAFEITTKVMAQDKPDLDEDERRFIKDAALQVFALPLPIGRLNAAMSEKPSEASVNAEADTEKATA